MTAYYNEIDPYAAQWLRNLIAAGHIAPGEVDERSIVDVHADDLKGYTQCHFFAGIGGWSYAARIAGWSDGRAMWTGSCPCQPLSSAGLRKGHADERHLWPAFYRLISECRPPVVLGEQAANKDGREWLSAVRADMESLGHAFGAADLCAAGVGRPHIRQRLFWLAHAERWGLQGRNFRRSQQTAVELASIGSEASGVHGWSEEGGEPELAFVAHGLPSGVAAVRAYGNAIVPQVAAEIIGAYMDIAILEAERASA
ncbi:DNA cytosine methyltransferase [Rhizobium sp. NZLR11]|uniref:DNA cytosine methyltransferase n=1 Tax=Rhizobium sp. NZLR11 TaxID=2731098 RepID=UPI001C836160|nr:DNA cytosine methyltransferase [Rhizobium sp. NZLR11]MBX5206712.1 DNA cytosine methyltransferase [Rhizobium sp. NZLR11]